MARWEVTISQPAGSPNALSPVVLRAFGEDGYKRTTRLANTFGDTTIGGAAIVEGTAVPFIHEWELSAIEFETVALGLEALVAWQQNRLSNRLDGRLILQDEFEYTLPMFGTHPKTLLAGSSIAVGTGYTTGFPVCNVLIALPDQHKAHIGVADGVFGKQISVIAVEVP